MTTKIIKAFPNEKISLQHSVLSYQIDLYFTEHKLTIEVDEKRHTDRNIGYEINKQKAIEKNLELSLLKLILMKKIMIFLLKLVKYTITLNQLKNQPKNL